MEAVYFHDEKLKCCPVKRYFEQYEVDIKDTPKQKDRKLKLLVDLNGKIQMVVKNNGKAIAPIATPLKEYGCIEIRHRKNQDILIRIIYFRHESKVVLLHAFEKPDNYDSERDRRKVRKEFAIAQNRKNIFINNPKLYEEYY